MGHKARKGLLAAVGTIIAGACAAPSASAQVEVHPLHCNPCTFHMVSESFGVGDTVETEIWAHVLGVEAVISECEEEFEGEVYEDGEGHIAVQELAEGPNLNCTREACDTPAEEEWPAHIDEVASDLVMSVELCFEPIGGGTETHCDIDLVLTDLGDNDWEAAAEDSGDPNHTKSCATSGGEVEGMWHFEATSHDELAITH